VSCPTLQRPSFEEQERRFLDRLAALRNEQPSLLLALQDLLLDFERRIALLERCLPVNFSEAVFELEQGMRRGQYRAPRFVYARPDSEIGQVAREMASLCRTLGGLRISERFRPVLAHLVERAFELNLEAQLAVAGQSTPASNLVGQRYLIESGDAELAARLAEQWLSAEDEERVDDGVVELATFLRARAQAEGVAVMVLERPIASLAAASTDGLAVQPGARVAHAEAERIWVHEVHAHFLPRRRGPHSCAPLAAGTKGGADDEEGRALWLEQKFGLLRAARKRDLAVRHVIATTVRTDKARLGEVVLKLLAEGCDARCVARAVARALRGGGLAREAIYLPAFFRVKRCLEAHPQAELWMRWGRVSAAAAVELDHWL